MKFVYAHLNRVILARDLDVLSVCGPGQGGPAMVANTYLEGAYADLYPHVSREVADLTELVHQFSFPGGIPSHAAPETPGSINEAGELGCSLPHAYGPPSTTPTSSPAASSGTAKPRSAPWQRRGIPTSS